MEVAFLVKDLCHGVLVLYRDGLVLGLAPGTERLDLDFVVSTQVVLLDDHLGSKFHGLPVLELGKLVRCSDEEGALLLISLNPVVDGHEHAVDAKAHADLISVARESQHHVRDVPQGTRDGKNHNLEIGPKRAFAELAVFKELEAKVTRMRVSDCASWGRGSVDDLP